MHSGDVVREKGAVGEKFSTDRLRRKETLKVRRLATLVKQMLMQIVQGPKFFITASALGLRPWCGKRTGRRSKNVVQQIAPTVVGDSTAWAGWHHTAVLRLTVKPKGTGTDGFLSTRRAEKRSWGGRKSLLGAANFEHMVEEVAPPVVNNLAVRTGALLSIEPMHASMNVHLIQGAEGLTAVWKGASQFEFGKCSLGLVCGFFAKLGRIWLKSWRRSVWIIWVNRTESLKFEHCLVAARDLFTGHCLGPDQLAS